MSREKRLIAYLEAAIKLEDDAIKRYTTHIEKIENPYVNSILEGIRRNEIRHLRWIKKALRTIVEER